MRVVLEIARTGWTAVLLHPLRSAVTASAVVAALVPYLVGMGISQGLRDEAQIAVRSGGDLYVSGQRFGRPAPVPLSVFAEIRELPGVISVIPRIVGRVTLGADRVGAVVVGTPLKDFPQALECIEGRLYSGGKRNEFVVGSDLARRLHLGVGSLIPPFYHNPKGERISEVVGVFRSDVSFWQARLIVTSLDTAAHVFDQQGLATDLVVHCRPGYAEEVRRAILQSMDLPDGLRPRIVQREDLAVVLAQGLGQREGVFTMLFALAFVMTILVILVTSGFGLSERRREIGILKATGWQTDQILFRSFVECLVLSLAGAAAAVLLAWIWLKALNGYWIAGIFLAGVERTPGFQVPFRLMPTPVLLAFLVAFVVVLCGSVYSTWRAAVTPPREAMRQ
ncbi:MAG: FtsX-like permease family protein [Gemmataceae bacterium]|nr:FtsX-like permease family protein [Gemmataceae bacterium]